MTYRRRNAACGLRMQTREHIPLLILQLCVSQLIHNYVYIYIYAYLSVCLSVCFSLASSCPEWRTPLLLAMRCRAAGDVS